MLALTDIPDTLRQVLLAFLLALVSAPAFCVTEQGAVSLLHASPQVINDPHEWLRLEERERLEARLTELWYRNGLRVSVVIDSPQQSWESLESYAERIAGAWGVSGNSAQPGGILLLVDPHARRAALIVAHDRVMDFPSGEIGRIINGNVNPLLTRGELAGGISEGIKRLSAHLAKPTWMNRSLFARGYGVLAAFGLFFAGLLLKRRWGVSRGVVVAALPFAALVCFDGLTLGFPWYSVIFAAALAASFLGLFVWIGMGKESTVNRLDQSK